jgi:hypothetical protein
MFKLMSRVSLLFVLSILPSIQGSMRFEQENTSPSSQTHSRNQEAYQKPRLSPDFGKIPLYFVPNKGQVDEVALFYAKTSRYTLWLTEEGLVFDSTRRIRKESAEPKTLSPRDMKDAEDFSYEREISRLVFVKANRSPEVIPVGVTEHKVNYFIGKDESTWQANIQTSRAVLYKGLFPNIDLKIYGVEKQIEYDFFVKPGGEVSEIGFEYQDVEKTRIDNESNLIVDTEFGEIKHAKPVCYQVIGGERLEIQAEFMKIGENNYGFKVKGYNRNYELIIDPEVLVYSTYLGGSGEESGNGIAVDSEGAAYVTGYTDSMNFPAQNPIQGTNAGGSDIFITKVNSSGDALIYSTYLGGSGGDYGNGIAVDSEGAAYVTGSTESANFPTKNAIQGGYGGQGDAVIAKVNSSGSALIYSTYLGGSGEDRGNGIAVDSEGAAYVTGDTGSIDFPTQNPIQGISAGGYDIFITKVNSSGDALIYSTYLGGSSAWDRGWSIAVDSKGAAYVAGDTCSMNFPTQNPIQGSYAGRIDAFITKINSLGTALVYSTYLGGSGGDNGFVIGVDSEGAACMTGVTWSSDFPTQNPIQGSFGGGSDIFITKVNSSGDALIYSTYLGGSELERGWGIAADSEGAAYVAGDTESANFPTKNAIQGNNLGDRDIFIAKLALSDITPATYSLTVAASSGGTTEPSPGTHTYDEGTVVTIRAVPNSGHKFSGWSGAASGTDTPINIIMDSDKSITASFSKIPRDDDGGGGGGGCFIATACYGTSMAEEVKTLSAFRDRYLMTNPTGEAMANFYKTYSPKVAEFIRDKEDLKLIIRACLEPIVWIINEFF